MAEGRYFANLNPFPVTVPNPRGGQRSLSPNEVVEGDWWSRLCGNRQLTEIDPENYNIIGRKIVQGSDIRRGTKGAPIKRINPRGSRVSKVETLADDICQSGCEMSCEGQCELNIQGIEEYDHVRGVAGQYYCKYCEYKSPIKDDVDAHIEREHAEQLNPNVPSPEGEVVDTDNTKEPDGLDSPIDDIVEEPIREDDIVDENDRFNDIDSIRSDVDNFGEEPKEEKTTIGVKSETDDYRQYEDGMYECKECGKRYKESSYKWLVKHINDHRVG